MIPYLKTIHNGPVGYSDHTEGSHIPLVAVALGADVINAASTLLAAVSRGCRSLLGAGSEGMQALCGWIVLATADLIQGVTRLMQGGSAAPEAEGGAATGG